MKAITTILTVLALTGFTLKAADETAPKKPKMSPEEAFKKLDKDANGSVSKEEFMAGGMAKKDPVKGEERFKKLDKDGDGSISKEEFTPKPKKAE